ncbi:MAG: TonB-dependent receptor plug domain-containing protein [Candidatus Kapaibacterium sp.]
MILAQALAFAGDKQDSVWQMPLVDVVGERILSIPEMKYSPNSLIGPDQISRSQPWQLSEALDRQTGLFIRDYGGLGGMKSISLRGAASSQTMVMIDGISLSSAQTGMADLSALPVALLESAEIIRGGQSAFLGGGALGGVVNFRLAPLDKDRAVISARHGSFGEWLISGGGNINIYNSRNSAFVEYSRADGDYPINTPEGSIRRDNADYRNAAFTLASDIESIAKVRYFFRDTRRGTPGPVIKGRPEDPLARLNESHHFALISLNNFLNKFINDENSSYSLDISFRSLATDYSSPGSVPDSAPGADAEYLDNEFSIHTRMRTLFGGGVVALAAGYSHSRLNGENIIAEQIGKARRDAAFGAASYELGGNDLSGVAALRYDAFSDAGGSLSGSIGAMAALPLSLSARANASYNFRPPSFNEMYYLNYGTADLRPEKSVSLNFGLGFEPVDYFRIGADAFLIDMHDRIIAIPRSPISWSAQNISLTRSAGIELSADAEFLDKKLIIGANYSYQRVEDRRADSYTFGDQLPYTPQEMIGAGADWIGDCWGAGAQFEYIGHRFYLPENSAENLMPAYNTLNIYAFKTFIFSGGKIALRGEILNALDERYAIILNYPLPGRYFRVGITTKFGE